MHEYGIGIGGQLTFNGNIRGKLADPDVNGQVSLGSLLVNGTELGTLSATLAMNAAEMRVTDGRLSEKDGGGIQFSVVAPRTGENNASLEATLDRVNATALLAVSPFSKNDQLNNTQSEVSGVVKITGIPKAMSGSADLRFGPGKIAGEPLESLIARATFNGSDVSIENIDVHLTAGHIVASGKVNTSTQLFDFQGKAEGVELARLSALANRPGFPPVTGIADFTAHVSGSLGANDFSNYQITFDGTGRDVTINGRPAGSVALVGRTENKQLSITLTSGILGSPQVIAAQVNLGSERLSASVETTLTNADLTNLLSLLIPNNKVRVSGRANGTIKASGDLLDDDNNFTLGRTDRHGNIFRTYLSRRRCAVDCDDSPNRQILTRRSCLRWRKVHRYGHQYYFGWDLGYRKWRQSEFEHKRKFEPSRLERRVARLLLDRHCGSCRSR